MLMEIRRVLKATTARKKRSCAAERLVYLAAEQQEVEGKVDGEDQHEERDDDLNGGAFIGRNRQVSGGEAAGACGGEGVNQAVIPRHAGDSQAEDL